MRCILNALFLALKNRLINTKILIYKIAMKTKTHQETNNNSVYLLKRKNKEPDRQFKYI